MKRTPLQKVIARVLARELPHWDAGGRTLLAAKLDAAICKTLLDSQLLHRFTMRVGDAGKVVVLAVKVQPEKRANK